MSRERVARMHADKGDADIHDLEADDGHWEADATLAGRTVEVHVDPHSGAITESESDDD